MQIAKKTDWIFNIPIRSRTPKKITKKDMQTTAQRFALLAGGRAWIKLQEQDSVRA